MTSPPPCYAIPGRGVRMTCDVLLKDIDMGGQHFDVIALPGGMPGGRPGGGAGSTCCPNQSTMPDLTNRLFGPAR